MPRIHRTLASSLVGLTLVLIGCDKTATNESSTLASGRSAMTRGSDGGAALGPRAGGGGFTRDFRIQDCTFATQGQNPFFPIIPGRTVFFAGEEDGVQKRLEQATTGETLTVDGVLTRVLVENHYDDDELVEVSRNYFAHCTENSSVFYFGEDVDNYENGEIVNHDGSWHAGVNGAKPGLIMPGLPLVGARYYQEIAPGAALDRAEIIQQNETVATPYGQFTGVLVSREDTPLDLTSVDFKSYTPGVGLIVDVELRLTAITLGN